jgi:hypothetical protein
MVGLLKKIRNILKFVQDNSHLANFIVRGLGPLVKSVGALGENVTDRAEKVYDAYQSAKQEGKKFKFKDGVQTFFKDPDLSGYFKPVINDIQNIVTQNRPAEAVKTMTKAYGGLHPRLKLK